MAGTVITAKGRALIAKLIAAEGAIEFTRASVGTGALPSGYDPSGMNNLNQYRMDGKITAADAADSVANITFQIASQNVDEGFLMTEAGLFAVDPDEGEILYAYLDMSKDPQYIYKKGGEINKVAEITLGVIIGQIDKVTTAIAPDGLVTKEKMEEIIEGIQGQITNAGKVIIGNEDAEMELNDTLFVLQQDGRRFEAASYSNLYFGASPPADGDLWAGIVEGDLTVSEDLTSDTIFLANINEPRKED